MIPRKLSSEIAHKNPWYQVRHDKVEWPNDYQGDYYVIEGWEGVAVIAIQDDKILIVRQYRYPIEQRTVELPMGSVKGDESLEQAAERELKEETGYKLSALKKIGTIYINAGVSNVGLHVYEALELSLMERELDKEEQDMDFEWIPLDEWRKLIAQNMVIDADTLAAWALYSNKHKL